METSTKIIMPQNAKPTRWEEENTNIVEEATARLGKIRIRHVRKFDEPVQTKGVTLTVNGEVIGQADNRTKRSKGIPYATIATLIRDGKAYAAASFCHKNDCFNKTKGIQIAIARLEKLINDNHVSPLAKEVNIEKIKNLDVKTIQKAVDNNGNTTWLCQKELVEL